MGALTMLGKKFKRFQDQVWARFDSLGEQITFVDLKVSIGGEYNEPQVYPFESFKTTQSPYRAQSFYFASLFISVLVLLLLSPLILFFLMMKKRERNVRTDVVALLGLVCLCFVVGYFVLVLFNSLCGYLV